MAWTPTDGVTVTGEMAPGYDEILTAEACAFLASLQRTFNPTRVELLKRRAERDAAIQAGEWPSFLDETRSVREGDWTVAPTPDDLQDRRVEITGPVDAKMIINALNSGANVFMADLEDANSPTWANVVEGQRNLRDAVRHQLTFRDEKKGKDYALNDTIATLFVRPRGWHLEEKHVLVDGAPMSASLFDFGLYFFHNAQERLNRGTGPYFYLPKLESHLEARLWNDVFKHAQDALGIPQGSVRVTVLIETLLAAFEMEEILYELRDHMAGLNAGRWDYIFSVIKKFRNSAEHLLPDRGQVTMSVGFMRSYTELLVRACHRRGAHAIGGMAAFIPSRRDAEINAMAFKKVREDKEAEAKIGFDGTWVAHPDLVPVAREVFDAVLGDKPNQKDRLREDVSRGAKDLNNTFVEGGQVTREGITLNINVAIQYLGHWLHGRGAVGINNLMEDAATAEISRAQLWQWLRHNATLASGETFDEAMYTQIREAELAKLQALDAEYFNKAAELLDALVLTDNFEEFLTLRAYKHLD